MSIVRDSFGAIILEDLERNCNYKLIQPMYKDNTTLKRKSIIEYDNNLYYIKLYSKEDMVYNELIAEEIAKDYEIPVSFNDLVSYNGYLGNISKKINDNNTIMVPLSAYINPEENNLEDIQRIFYHLFDKDTYERLIDQLINIFIFDILIANIDRHTDNIFIESYNGNINFSKLFDNEYMLSSESITFNYYTLGVDSKDFNSDCEYNMLEKFLTKYADTKYIDLLKSKLWIIKQDNFEQILKRVEEKIQVPIIGCIREKLIMRMKQNYKNIERIIKEYNGKVYKY